ncbi:MAG: YjbQ family protein [Anaerolineales bacterium]|nr:YjbQ family protein [Anaerolineales bacterium]
MAVSTHALQLQTAGHCDTKDLTGAVTSVVKESNIRNGIVNVFCPGSTGGLTTIEYESGALADLRRLFDEIAPENREYLHNRRWGDGNGHSHIRAALLGPSLTVPLVDGQLLLGTWQQIILVDFDNRQRNRKIVVQIVGE